MNLTYNEAINKITDKAKFYIDLSLERISSCLELFGNPQEDLNIIHVAGTNGKGSVCAILSSIIEQAGYKTGLYTSPHIIDYTERIKINGNSISKDKFAKYTNKILNCGIHLTEFEILTVIMFMYFKDNNIDVAVVETGLGGRLDATNVITKNLCSVITHIDLDHTDRLGSTKEQIAFEKAGIIKNGCPVLTGMNYESIKRKAKEENSQLVYILPNVDKKYVEALSLKGFHQEENLSLALGVIKKFFPDISEKVILKGLKEVQHPCRFEYYSDKNLIIDGSHNPNGIEALRKNLDFYFPKEKRRYIFGALKTKDYKRMMNILFREGDEIYLNGFNYPNACTYEELLSSCPYEAKKYTDNLVISNDKLNIICGSFYMIGDMIKNKKDLLL